MEVFVFGKHHKQAKRGKQNRNLKTVFSHAGTQRETPSMPYRNDIYMTFSIKQNVYRHSPWKKTNETVSSPFKCQGIETSSTSAPFVINLFADFLTKSFTSASKLGLKPSLSKPTRKPLISPLNCVK